MQLAERLLKAIKNTKTSMCTKIHALSLKIKCNVEDKRSISVTSINLRKSKTVTSTQNTEDIQIVEKREAPLLGSRVTESEDHAQWHEKRIKLCF